MAYLAIHKALMQSVIDLALGIPIAYENKNFNPESVLEYIQLTNSFDDQQTVNKTNLDDVDGFMQLSYYAKASTYVEATYVLIDTLNAAYPHARKITSGTQTVNIQNIAVNKRGNVNGWYVTDFTIYFWSDISRN